MTEQVQFTDTGKLGMYYLKSVWYYYSTLRNNPTEVEAVPWKYINGIFNALGIGTEPTIQYLMSADVTFEEFEAWIAANGSVSQPIIDQFNAVVQGENKLESEAQDKVLTADDLAQWDKEGYVIVRNAISKTDCEATVGLIYDSLDADSSDVHTWYNTHPLKQGIMVQLFSHPILDKNRLSPKIKAAYQQLWNRDDLLVSMDRVSFNPPETNYYQFPGPNLHWDVSLKRPIPYGLQGLLYLTDTAEDQGAFTIIPGFHNYIENWLDQLESDQNPRDKELLASFQTKPIGANAGDFIIWNQCLPHGSSPNTSQKPRIVQYINYQPLDFDYHSEWI